MAEHYRPSCGTEGMCFQEDWCGNCTKNRPNAKDGGCKIIVATLIYDVEDADYPPEWRYDDDGRPICTAFKDKASVVRGPRITNRKPKETDAPLFDAALHGQGGGNG